MGPSNGYITKHDGTKQLHDGTKQLLHHNAWWDQAIFTSQSMLGPSNCYIAMHDGTKQLFHHNAWWNQAIVTSQSIMERKQLLHYNAWLNQAIVNISHMGIVKNDIMQLWYKATLAPCYINLCNLRRTDFSSFLYCITIWYWIFVLLFCQ